MYTNETTGETLDINTLADAIAPGAHGGEDAPATAAKIGQSALENMADELAVIVGHLEGLDVRLANVVHRIAERAQAAATVVGKVHRAELAKAASKH